MKKGNFKSLHIIRGICALLVVVYHSKFVLWCGGTLWTQNIGFKHFYDYFLFGIDMLSSCGRQCVLVFFLLSGFVIYHSFNQSGKNVRQFYVIRAIRIYVPYIFSVLFSILVLIWLVRYNEKLAVNGVREYNTRLLSAYNDINWSSICKAMFFVKSQEYPGFNPVYWSLLHEAIFYLLFPLYFFSGTRGRIVFFSIAFAGYFFMRSDFFYYQLYFLSGMFLYDYYKKERKLILGNRKVYVWVLIAGFCLVNILTKQAYEIYADLMALVVVVLAFDYLLIAEIKPHIYLNKLADMSFSLYLNHMPVLMICYGLFAKFTGTIIIYQRYPYYVGVIVAVVVSWFSYRLIEARSLALINSIKNKNR
ncbi:MAG: acyltransferase family protein [Bacteroidia bacterium]